nr:hypothetical protein [Streptomyces sp. MUSC 14]
MIDVQDDGYGDGDGLSGGSPSGTDLPGMPSGAEPWDSRAGERLGTGRTSPQTPSASTRALVTSESASASAPVPASSAARPAPRRGAADPVKALLHRHRELCERAVDPLEIAAGLEAHGITDRTAARFRHRDVFSLAEELYARVPRSSAEAGPGTEPLPVPRVRAGWVLLTLLPGALGAATTAGLRLTHGHPRLLVALVGLLTLCLAARAALRHGPLAGPPRTRAWHATSATRAWSVWLLGYALFGGGLLSDILTGGPDALPTGAPDAAWPTAVAPVLALTLACAPAAWCAHLLGAGARRRLADSRGLEDFTASVRPLLFGTFTLFVGTLTALLLLCGTVLRQPPAYAQTLTLGALLLLARLLAVHRHRRAPALALGTAAAAEVAALALPLTGRLPGCAVLAAPVRALVNACGPAAVPALACGAAALALLFHAGHTLTRASAHALTEAPE